MKKKNIIPDRFTLAIIGAVVSATFLPCKGSVAASFDRITHAAIALLFFLHGAKLSRDAVIEGATHWRLHLVMLASTFAVFPMYGLMLRPLLAPLVTQSLYLGVLFLCTLPSTVQSSIAFTSMARGNVPAAVCGASASNLVGIFLTPLLVSVLSLSQAQGGVSAGSVVNIIQQLLLPFVAGQMARRWLAGWVERHRGFLRLIDQGTILLIVYTAFSEAVVSGLWHQLTPGTLASLVAVNLILLGLILLTTTYGSRFLRFSRKDEISIVFCGSKKSLASGVPMAKLIFAGHPVGLIVLPLMLFHQIQLLACAVLAQRYAAHPTATESGGSTD